MRRSALWHQHHWEPLVRSVTLVCIQASIKAFHGFHALSVGDSVQVLILLPSPADSQGCPGAPEVTRTSLTHIDTLFYVSFGQLALYSATTCTAL